MEPNPRLKEVVDPRLIKGLALEMQNPLPLDSQSSLEDMHAVMTAREAQNNYFGELFLASKAKAENITHEVVSVKGTDDNDVSLFISRPSGLSPDDKSSCVMYIHGGGMGLYRARGPIYSHFTDDLAAEMNATVIAVEFRNSSGELGPHPFPAGLHDCKAALEWVHAQREARHFERIIVCGESGGANLSIALTLLMKSEGKQSMIDGLYTMCPYISGLYSTTETEESKLLPSLRAFDHCGIIELHTCDVLARLYDPTGQHSRNPLAWPHWATVEDLRGFPPCVVSVNEADPLCDEGLAFYRKLMQAEVAVRGRTVLGTPHAGDLLCMNVLPSLYLSLLCDIKTFVRSL